MFFLDNANCQVPSPSIQLLNVFSELVIRESSLPPVAVWRVDVAAVVDEVTHDVEVASTDGVV